jgi:hypothetical protein
VAWGERVLTPFGDQTPQPIDAAAAECIRGFAGLELPREESEDVNRPLQHTLCSAVIPAAKRRRSTLAEVSWALSKPDGLQRLFKEYNRRYFGEKLCTLPVTWSATVFRRYTALVTFEDDSINPIGIVIAKRIQGLDSVVARTLLHEMVHLALHRTHQQCKHGDTFQREMLRLATMGEFEELW